MSNKTVVLNSKKEGTVFLTFDKFISEMVEDVAPKISKSLLPLNTILFFRSIWKYQEPQPA